MNYYAIQQKVDADIERRVLRNAVICTRGLATDGYLIDPQGMDIARYLRNPIVEARHGGVKATGDIKPTVIARTLQLFVSDQEVVSELQFADNQLGRDYAYLYGVNPENEPYMRAWSVDVAITRQRAAGMNEARRFAGALWDEELAQNIGKKAGSLRIADTSELLSFSAVPFGSDRRALTRAFDAGVEAAGQILTRMDLEEAGDGIEILKQSQERQEERIAKLEAELQALRSQGTAAAAQGDTAELLAELRSLIDQVRQ